MKNPKLSFFLIVLLLFSGLISAFAGLSEKLQTDTLPAKNKNISKALVIGAKSMKRNRTANSAVFGDLLEVKINRLDYLLNPDDTCCTVMIDTLIFLSLNGMPCTDIPVISFDRSANSVIFSLDRNSNSLKRIARQFTFPWEKILISDVSLCIKGNSPMATRVTNFVLSYASPRVFLFSIFFILLIMFLYIKLVKSTNFIRVGKERSTFSLAQAQMAFWTLLVSSSVLYIWLTTNNLPDLTGSTLTLMGISIITTAGAKSVYFLSKDKPQTEPISEGFWKDILSDANSVNIHRFQMVLWTVILGFIYVQKVIFYQQIPDFSDTYLILTGISSGAYVLLKTIEDKTKPNITINGKNSSSESDQVPAIG